MSAYLELRSTGKLGADGATMLYQTTADVIRFARIPPPDGQPAWTVDEVRGVAHDFLADARTPRRFASMLLRATDDRSLTNLLEASVRNFLRDRARQTDHGAFHRRLREVLRAVPGIWAVSLPDGEAWTTDSVGEVSQPLAPDLRELHAAAWSIETPMVRWRSSTRRDPIDAAALAAVCAAVIEAREAPVPTRTLVEIGLQRFALSLNPAVADLDDDPPASEPPLADLVVDRAAAHAAFMQLTERERTLLTVWDAPVRTVASAIGLGPSATAVAIRRLEELLTELLDQQAEPETVWRELQHLAHAWEERRTWHLDVSSEEGEQES